MIEILKGKVIELAPAAIEWDLELQIVEVDIKILEGIKKRCRAQMLNAMGNAELGILPNGVKYAQFLVEKDEHVVKPTSYRDIRRLKARNQTRRPRAVPADPPEGGREDQGRPGVGTDASPVQ